MNSKHRYHSRLVRNIKCSRFVAMAIVLLVASACGTQKESDKTTQGAPKAQFDTLFHDFGAVHQGEIVACTFTLTNAGTDELVIQDVIASCGCTVVNYQHTPVSPGKEAQIQVEFDTSGRKGMQYKRILVKTNAPKQHATLSIKANVLVE